MKSVLPLLALLLMSCGSRSSLDAPRSSSAAPGRRDAGMRDAGRPDAGVDAGRPDGGPLIELCSQSLMGGIAGASPFGDIDMQVRELNLADCCTFIGDANLAFEGPTGDRLELRFQYEATCEGDTRQVVSGGVQTQTMEASYFEPDGTQHVVLVRADWEIGELQEVRPLGPHRASIRGHIGNDEWDARISLGGGFCDWAERLC